MTQLIETATFEALELKLRGKFENVITPLLIMHQSVAPFGVDLESVFSPLPAFAGGTDLRRHLVMQLEISEDAARGFNLLDEACAGKSAQEGTWSPLVSTHEGRYLIKVRIYIEGGRQNAFRLGEGELLTGWDNLDPIMVHHRNLRGMTIKCAIAPQYVWCVNGKRGIALCVDQFVMEPKAQVPRIDHFA